MQIDILLTDVTNYMIKVGNFRSVFFFFSSFGLSNKLTPSKHKNSSSFCPVYGNHVAEACSDQ